MNDNGNVYVSKGTAEATPEKHPETSVEAVNENSPGMEVHETNKTRSQQEVNMFDSPTPDGKTSEHSEPNNKKLTKNPYHNNFSKEEDTSLHGKETDEEIVLNPHIRYMVDAYSREITRSQKNFTPIHVDEMASRLARFYEKIRKVIDWKDDSALRRGAIARILKRILFPKLAGFVSKNYDSQILSEIIATELIRGGHLPNHTVPKERIGTSSQALNKYLYFFEYVSNNKSFRVKQKTNLATFILEIAACEIEEVLANPVKEREVVSAMTKILSERIAVTPPEEVTDQEKMRLTNISVYRTLYDLDDNYIIYQLLKQKYSDWHNLDSEQIKEVSQKLPAWWKNAYEEINRPINGKFDAIAEKVDTVFLLLDDVLEEVRNKPREIHNIFEKKVAITDLITKAYEKRYKSLKTRLLHLAFFSTLSVFLSNWVTFYIVEVPLARIFYEGFNVFAAVVDFLIPTLVMFFMVVAIRPPKPNNLQKILTATSGFVYSEGGQEYHQIKTNDKKHTLFYIFMTVIYILSAWVVFAFIASVFYLAQLPITSVIFDTFTIALTVFAAVVIRNQSKELNVDEDRNVWDFVFDIITLPIAKVGSVLAKKWKEYNIVAIFFNFVIETPFAAVLDFIQGWSEYLKERRSELH